MTRKFSQRTKDVLSYSKAEAQRLGNNYIGNEHFFLGILKEGNNIAVQALTELGADVINLQKSIEHYVPSNTNIAMVEPINYAFNKSASRSIKVSHLEATAMQKPLVGPEHLLLAMLRFDDNVVFNVLKSYGIEYEKTKEQIVKLTVSEDAGEKYRSNFTPTGEMQKRTSEPELHSGDEATASKLSSHAKEPTKEKSKTPVLDNFGRDITLLAESGALDPIVGREMEMERIAQILCRRKKNNPILIGEPGVGKSAIAEGLALRIVQKKVPRTLIEKRIFSLDIGSVVAGTKYRGQFEERIKALLNELHRNPEIILFIDEIHTIVGAGNSAGSLDASNMFKPALARGEIQCIGATTLDEYRENIENDGALERRFQRILVEPTSVKETLEILQNIKPRYEEHHIVKYSDDALEACVSLTTRYMSDRNLPDKAIDALDEAGSRVHLKSASVPKEFSKLESELEEIIAQKITAVSAQKLEEAAAYRMKEVELKESLEAKKQAWMEKISTKIMDVTEEDVAEVVAMMTGVPTSRVARSEGNRLVKMEKVIASSVIGQVDAVRKVTQAIRRNRAGLKAPNRPIGSFIFLGTTGVGKTHLAKVLAKYLFDSEEALIRIDMSEYMEKFAVSRLVGAPPGYVGYEEGGQLTEQVRRKPYSIVLFDEIEKAHADIFNILLQVLDEGQLTDSLGRKVSFKNTIIIMTSNLGTKQLKEFGHGVGFMTDNRKANKAISERGVIEKALKRNFSPEFLNRIDDIVIFNSLDKEAIKQIVDIELKEVYGRVEELGYKLRVSAKAKSFLVDQGFDSQYGARPLRRAIQKHIEDAVAEEIIRSKIKEGDTITIGYKNSEIVIALKPSLLPVEQEEA